MDHETLQRLLTLSGKTGDRIIVTDPAGEKPYVLMSLDQYEKLMGSNPESAATEKPSSTIPARRPSLPVPEDLDPPVDLSPARKKREIPLWKPTDKPKGGSAPAPAPAVPAGGEKEAVSEEQFYLEPLE